MQLQAKKLVIIMFSGSVFVFSQSIIINFNVYLNIFVLHSNWSSIPIGFLFKLVHQFKCYLYQHGFSLHKRKRRF